MNRTGWTGWGLIALGLGMAASSLLGPLLLGVIRFRITPSMENQLLGGDVISLVVVAPVAVVAGLLWLRAHPLAPPLALAPALYAVYTYLTNILVPDYIRYPGNNERFFPLFIALIVLGWLVAASAWTALEAAPPMGISGALRWTLTGLLLVMSSIIGLTWWQQIAVVMGGRLSPEYLEHPTAFWLIRTLDTAFIIPAALVTAIGLLRHRAVALRAAFGLAGLFACLGGSVAAMAGVMQLRQDPAASPVLLVIFLGLATLFAAVTVLLLRLVIRAAPMPRRHDRRVDLAESGRT